MRALHHSEAPGPAQSIGRELKGSLGLMEFALEAHGLSESLLHGSDCGEIAFHPVLGLTRTINTP